MSDADSRGDDNTLDPGQLGLSDMTPDGFRAAGRAVVDHIADYLENLDSYPVLPSTQPGQTRAKLPVEPPDDPEPIATILNDYRHIIEPNLTHWQHPSFLGYFAISGSGPGILGDALASAANINGMLWRTSPSATELEERTLDWLRRMMALPETFDGIITDTASISSLLAVAAARQRIPGLDVREKGLAGRPEIGRLILYTSTQTHSSLDKAAILLGHGLDSVRKIPEDEDFRLNPGELRRQIEKDRDAGHVPFCVVATAGTTSTTSIDPIQAIADVCDDYGLWLHVDAAYGGSAAIVPEMRPLFEGMGRADSIVINPHKWLFVPMHMSVLFTRHPQILEAAFSLVPEYLRTTESSQPDGDEESVHDYMNYGVQLGRRFRAIKLWMVIRYFGVEGLRNRIREHIRLARDLRDRIDKSERLERLAPVPLSTVCFRAIPAAKQALDETRLNEFNELLMARLNATGKVFFSHTRLRGRFAIRFVVSSLRITEPHVHRALDLVLHHSEALERETLGGEDPQ